MHMPTAYDETSTEHREVTVCHRKSDQILSSFIPTYSS